MLSCLDMYKISKTLCAARNRPDVPFGGVNMIFAGDFAQLPPVHGGENASLFSRKIGRYSTDSQSQQKALGKVLWHMVTTVVLLRKNMRQQGASVDDLRMQRALENMRYGTCDDADIHWIATRFLGSRYCHDRLSDDRFRNVSIITARNICKDSINDLGVERFAAESNQRLKHFFSDDSKSNGGKGGPKVPLNPLLQNIVWNQAPSMNDRKMPGRLSLCVGMPIMIRANSATELCMTKGQEGTVYGWTETTGTLGQPVLNTLFVKLIDPPTNVNLPGLPENVVPIVKTSATIKCDLPYQVNGHSNYTIIRSQVEVLPNFAMTDYASQGKSRHTNVVDLEYCKDHHGIYVALSRGRTSDGTLIVRKGDLRKLKKKCSGALRQ
ncbi:uncharacterized protein SCHCODRAFT_02475478, partial [Schizophyllum commune H4-8]|uniref:uncharacterized protein n=1 Tax=Schizophyllum commune (strain H4-8 / FGSC 9210) TaxID=578458 RepID=UPI0021602D30